VQRNPYSLSVTPDGTRAFVANAGSNSVTVLNLQNRQLLGNVTVPASPEWRGCRRMANWLWFLARRKRVSLIDAQKLDVQATIPVCQNPEDIAILRTPVRHSWLAPHRIRWRPST